MKLRKYCGKHGHVCGAGEYVNGVVHTNNLDSFWSLLKPGVMGTYYNVSRKYVPLYLNEFSYHYNNRKNPDIFTHALPQCGSDRTSECFRASGIGPVQLRFQFGRRHA